MLHTHSNSTVNFDTTIANSVEILGMFVSKVLVGGSVAQWLGRLP